MKIKLEIESESAEDFSKEIAGLVEKLGSMLQTKESITTNVSEGLPAGRTVSAEELRAMPDLELQAMKLRTMTIPELKEIATDTHIDLTGKRTKAQILEALGVIEDEPSQTPNEVITLTNGGGASAPVPTNTQIKEVLAKAFEPSQAPEAVITIEDARAKATKLLKANPANREKVAAALKACGANKLTDITAPEDLKKFVGLLEAE